ncbi:MAG: S8 family serine peptidase [Candidatus Thorarchaeota archaeon]
MPAIHRPYYQQITAVIILTLLFTPFAVYSGNAENQVENKPAKLGTDLKETLATGEPESIVSVIVQFPAGTSSNEMVNTIRLAGIESVQIRYAFQLIPMVSLWIKSSDIQSLASLPQIEEITLNQKRQYLSEAQPQDTFSLADNSNGYVPFYNILGADLLWSEGFNGTGTTVAILDSGAWGEHPDLQNRLIGFRDYINNEDDMNPADGIAAYDDNGHGTACAWNVAGDGTASNGSLMGVAPGANLLIIKVLDSSGSGDDGIIAQGIEFAIQHDVDVISLSLGGDWQDQAFIVEPSLSEIKIAINAGISVAVAAGNSGPAAFTINSPGVAEKAVTVGSSFKDTGVVAFSSVGPVLRTASDPVGYTAKPDVVAPGYQVVSGRGDNVDDLEYPLYNASQYGNSYTRWSGTSASTPMVAGLIALLTQKHLALTPIEAKAALMSSATDLGDDPMSQGWGLANVSRASELLTNSSRDITLMTPRSVPTLPWSPQVLIAGDVRPPQNITIISTHSLGLVNITLSGNASQFVNTNVDQITIPTGYSYFSFHLVVPEDVPLSVAGEYVGYLNLTQGNNVITSMEVMYSITLFGGRLMVDMEHHSTGPNGDIDDPSYYGYFTEYLRDQGMVLSEFGNPEDLTRSYIDLSTISSADVFMIMDTETSYSNSEVNAIHEFVDNGGTLLVFSEFYDTSTNEASFAFDDYNRILEPFGIQVEKRSIGVGFGGYGLVYGANYSGYVENDPLMNGVRNLYVIQGSTLHVDPGVANATGLFWEDADRTHAIVATAEYGRGKVFVISDGSTLYDDILYDAITFGADNLRLLRNLASIIVPKAPRIYDVKLNIGELGQMANVTAYVFDEDLESVTISVIGPLGNNLTGAVTETLGYKFATSFIFNSGGFFSIHVEARDAAGNLRVFEKTILVPVDAADDAVVLTVIYVLLGVVGVGLGYVLILRFKGRQKPRPRYVEPKSEEDEWELPPPSIE